MFASSPKGLTVVRFTTSGVGGPDATMVLTAHLAGLFETTEDDAGGTATTDEARDYSLVCRGSRSSVNSNIAPGNWQFPATPVGRLPAKRLLQPCGDAFGTDHPFVGITPVRDGEFPVQEWVRSYDLRIDDGRPDPSSLGLRG